MTVPSFQEVICETLTVSKKTNLAQGVERFRLPLGGTPGIPGIETWYHAGNPIGVFTPLVVPVGDFVAVPFFVANGLNVDAIMFQSLSNAAGGKARVGIYQSNPTTFLPSTLIVDAGEKDLAASGQKQTIFAAPILLAAGTLYYFTYLCGVNAPQISAWPNTTMTFGTDNSFAPQTALVNTIPYAALPAVYPVDGITPAGSSAAPAIAVRLR